MRSPTVLKMLVALALCSASASFAGTISSCTNKPGSPDTSAGYDVAEISCTLYNDLDTYTISLAPELTQDYYGAVTPGYFVIIDGDPNTLSDDSNGLYDESLWVAVLFFQPDLDYGTGSDELTVYFKGAFPDASTVQTFDQNEYAGDGFPDSDFFQQATGNDTIYGAGEDDTYEILTPTPEPGSLLFSATGMAAVALLLWKRRMIDRFAA